jgi:hypothetical protein
VTGGAVFAPHHNRSLSLLARVSTHNSPQHRPKVSCGPWYSIGNYLDPQQGVDPRGGDLRGSAITAPTALTNACANHLRFVSVQFRQGMANGGAGAGKGFGTGRFTAASASEN